MVHQDNRDKNTKATLARQLAILPLLLVGVRSSDNDSSNTPASEENSNPIKLQSPAPGNFDRSGKEDMSYADALKGYKTPVQSPDNDAGTLENEPQTFEGNVNPGKYYEPVIVSEQDTPKNPLLQSQTPNHHINSEV